MDERQTERWLEQVVTTLARLDRMADSVVADAKASALTSERALHELAVFQALTEHFPRQGSTFSPAFHGRLDGGVDYWEQQLADSAAIQSTVGEALGLINQARETLRARLAQIDDELTPAQRRALRTLRERHHV